MPRQPAPSVSSILCPIDFAPPSRAALRYAARVARSTRARLTVLFVNDPLLVAAAAITLGERTIASRSRVALQQFVVRAIGRGTSPAVHTTVAVGDPAASILEAARRHHSDLIVLGTSGAGSLARLFFGSTTHEVVRRARVPVLIVDRHTRSRRQTAWPGRRLLVPLDLGSRALHDVRVAEALARASGASLHLVHVVTPMSVPTWYSLDPALIDRLRMTRARTRLDALAGRVAGADAAVLSGPIAGTIAAAASRSRSDLVVMGLRGTDGLLRARPGRIAYDVVCQAHVPVYVIPARRGRPARPDQTPVQP